MTIVDLFKFVNLETPSAPNHMVTSLLGKQAVGLRLKGLRHRR